MDDNYRWYLLKLKQHETMISRAFNRFREQGIEPVLIKGWVTAKLYPAGVPRFFTDNDLAVSHHDFNNAVDLCKDAEVQTLGIDLHNELRHLDTESWNNLFDRSQLLELNDTNIRILCPEDHLRLICVHWLTDGGAYKDRLWDIYYAVRNRHAGFDWDICLDNVGENRRRWIVCSIGLAHKYLSLEIDDLPFAADAKRIPPWIVKTVEKEWETPERLISLHLCLDDRKMLLRQIRRRLPPNPIQSTIEMEGSFDSGMRWYYQIGSIRSRLIPSIKKVSSRLLPGPQ